MYTLYMHIFPNNKRYIGITRQNPLKRWNNGKGYPTNEYMTNAIKKYGWENVKHEIIYTDLTSKEAEEKEIELISFFNSANRKYGYNIEHGGIKNCIVSDETREKNRLGHLHKHSRPYTEEMRKQHSNYMKEHWKDDEFKNKLLNGLKKNHCKKIMCVETNEIYESIVEAGIKTNINRRHIGECAKGYRKKAGGFHWRLVGVGND